MRLSQVVAICKKIISEQRVHVTIQLSNSNIIQNYLCPSLHNTQRQEYPVLKLKCKYFQTKKQKYAFSSTVVPPSRQALEVLPLKFHEPIIEIRINKPIIEIKFHGPVIEKGQISFGWPFILFKYLDSESVGSIFFLQNHVINVLQQRQKTLSCVSNVRNQR